MCNRLARTSLSIALTMVILISFAPFALAVPEVNGSSDTSSAQESEEASTGGAADSAADSGTTAENESQTILSSEVTAAEDTNPALSTDELTSVSYTRICGIDRYVTMRNLSLAAYGGTDVVEAIIVRGDDYKDAFAAAAYAGLKNAPIITSTTDALSTEAVTALLTLGVEKVTIIGGTASISTAVETFLREDMPTIGSVTRIAGDTSSSSSYGVYVAGMGDWSDTAIVATGTGFADALSIAPYANAYHAPIFLTQSDGTTLDADSLAAVQTFDKVIIVGGTGVVSETLETQLAGKEIIRLAGDGAYDTSAKIASWLVGLDTEAAFGPSVTFSWEGTAFATRIGYADALAGCVLQGSKTAPLLLVDDTDAANPVFSLIQNNLSSANIGITIFGGIGAVSADTADKITAFWGAKANQGEWEYSGELVVPTEVKYCRVSGIDRYATMRKLALAAYGEAKADNAIVVCGNDFKDALAATAYAHLIDAPILLTESNQLLEDTKTALITLDVQNVTIVGGTGVVTDVVKSQIEDLNITVSRLGGEDRYDTVRKIYEAGNGLWGDTAIVATGENFADALSISPYANAAAAPIFLVMSNGLFDVESMAAVETFQNVIIVGGDGVVSTSVDSSLEAAGCTVARLAGENAYETSVKIARWLVGLDLADVAPNVEFSWDGLALATRNGFADALAGSILQGKVAAPLLLIDDVSAASCSFDVLAQECSKWSISLNIFGGTGVVADATVSRVVEDWFLKRDGGAWEYSGKIQTGFLFADLSYYNTVTNWSDVASAIDLAILRVQDPRREANGDARLDPEYYNFVAGCEATGIPYACYAFVRYTTPAEAVAEAETYYALATANGCDPTFFTADVEAESLKNYNTRLNTDTFIMTLRALGAEKVGIYVSHSNYTAYNLDFANSDFIWIPRYAEDGTLESAKKPNYAYDIWQYTSTGTVAGITGPVDLNLMNPDGPNELTYKWYVS
ncbi:MAG: hypothetical protein HGA54_03030 [Actinobacteria bacterium]|nr:hypothetical protein [Actinomycetota bacterium]